MKKKLTVNTLAVGNLKQHKKQYAVMLCGIVLAMVFSSSVVFAIFSMIATNREFSKQSMGNQDFILCHTDEETMREAAEKGLVAEYGFAHTIAYAYTDPDEYDDGVSIAWLDDEAKNLSYISFLEGGYPANENEIAIEKTALLKLGIDAKVGDTVTLSVLTQNDRSYIGDAQEKTYKLVGIVRDKRSNLEWSLYSVKGRENDQIPAAFVCGGTQTAAGGKENLIAYGRHKPSDIYSYRWEDSDAFTDFLTQKGENFNDLLIVNRYYYSSNSQSLSKLTDNITFACVLGVVLMAASCLMIIGAFNTNLRERRKQIGLLRAVGTTRQQIITIFGREAFLIALLCTPVSAALSYGIVMILGHFLGGDFVPASVGWIVLSVAVSVVTVMLASLIPLVSASKITPMQAIRNIDINRKMKKRRIQSQSEFDVPKLLARRNLTFYKGSRIAVTVMLIVTIVFSCVGFSVMKQLRSETIENTTADYNIYISNPYAFSFFANVETAKIGLSDSEKRELEAALYIKDVIGVKSCHVNLLTDEITDFMRVMDDTIYNGFYDDGLTVENFLEMTRGKTSEEYESFRSDYGYTTEFFPMMMNAADDSFIEALESRLTAGKINLEKLASGEEVILVAPKKTELAVEVHKDGGYGWRVYKDNEEQKNRKMTVVLTADCDYKVGDTVTLSSLNADSMDEADGYELKNVTREDKTVTIGAIISPDRLQGFSVFSFYDDFCFLTSTRGIEHFSQNERYGELFCNADREITPEIDESITAALETAIAKYTGHVTSVYGSQQDSQQYYRSMFIAMLALIILDFAICASIVNNSLTARIRESKKEIGTLRAVGVSERDLVNSYIRQLLSMFAWGYGLGFALFLVIFFVSKLVMKKLEMGILMVFSPWATILFCVLLFALCSLNLWVRIRKEMKNSIVENIREL